MSSRICAEEEDARRRESKDCPSMDRMAAVPCRGYAVYLYFQCTKCVGLVPPVSKVAQKSPCDGDGDPASDNDGNNKPGLAGNFNGRGREGDGVDVIERAGMGDSERFHLAEQ
jgi:hypothetical protein